MIAGAAPIIERSEYSGVALDMARRTCRRGYTVLLGAEVGLNKLRARAYWYLGGAAAPSAAAVFETDDLRDQVLAALREACHTAENAALLYPSDEIAGHAARILIRAQALRDELARFYPRGVL